MGRKIGMMFVWLIALSASIYAQTADRAMSAAVMEARSYVNSCGTEGAPQWFNSTLNRMSGNTRACDQHDIEYGTLGMTRDRADMNLGEALYIDSLSNEHPAIATAFWSAVRIFGTSAYNNAQQQSRQEFRRIHHGNDWQPGYGMWHPSDGHIQMSFSQCTQSCSYY